MIPVSYGYVRVSKADRDEKNLEDAAPRAGSMRLIRDLIFVDDEAGETFKSKRTQPERKAQPNVSSASNTEMFDVVVGQRALA